MKVTIRKILLEDLIEALIATYDSGIDCINLEAELSDEQDVIHIVPLGDKISIDEDLTEDYLNNLT